MKYLFNSKIIFFGIIVIASFLRLYQLGKVPISPDWDEVSFGYNAYSILKTGRDEFGVFLPLALRSFGEYKPPFYAYVSIPFIALFGLNVWSIRIVAAISGIFAVVGTYFLTKELMNIGQLTISKRQEKTSYAHCLMSPTSISLMVSFILAISPWHIHFSRVAFESITSITLNIWGAYAFLRGLKQPLWLIGSAILFGIAMYSYHSERIFGPLLVIAFITIFHRSIFLDNLKKYFVVAGIIGFTIILPLLPMLTDDRLRERLIITSPFTNEKKLLKDILEKQTDDMQRNDPSWRIFDNRRIVWIKTFLEGYLAHDSFNFLFIKGDKNSRHGAPNMGLLYVIEIPFFLYGLYLLWKKGGALRSVMLAWLLLSPIAAAPTNELPHAGRTMIFMPSLQIVTAIGIIECYIYFVNQKKIIKNFFIFFIGIGYFCNYIYFLNMYFVHMNHEVSQDWQYGYEQAVRFAEAHKQNYRKVVVSMNLEQPHIFFLFYTAYDPQKYLKNGGTLVDAPTEVKNRFDIYEFRKVQWDTEVLDGQTLIIGKSTEMPRGNLLSIAYPDGSPAIEIADRKN